MVCCYRATLGKLLSTIFICPHEQFSEVFIIVIKLGNLQNEAYEHLDNLIKALREERYISVNS
jgi:hypothetical protein